MKRFFADAQNDNKDAQNDTDGEMAHAVYHAANSGKIVQIAAECRCQRMHHVRLQYRKGNAVLVVPQTKPSKAFCSAKRIADTGHR